MFSFFKSSVSQTSQMITNTLRFGLNFLNSNPQLTQMLIFSALSTVINASLYYDTGPNLCGCIEGVFNGTNPNDFKGYWLEPKTMCDLTSKTGVFYNASHEAVYSREPESVCQGFTL